MKNPVGKLEEIMMLRKRKVEYNLVSTDDLNHSPTFTVCANCDDIIGKQTLLSFYSVPLWIK